jgi:dipeptidyl aminopeptidase/acylaminoacyl peptidase
MCTLNKLPERLEQLDFSKNSRLREALRARLLSQAAVQLPGLTQQKKRNVRLSVFIRLTAIAAALVAFTLFIKWPVSYFAPVPANREASTSAIDINQIVSATFQAMTQDARQTAVVVPTGTPIPAPEINQVFTATFQVVTEEVQQTAVVVPTETPIPAPDINQAATASFLQVMTQAVQQSTMPIPAGTPIPTSEISAGLPGSLYYISYSDRQTGTGNQIYRMEQDGKTISQITTEAGEGVRCFDVSTIQGRIVYIAGNQLLLIDLNGTDRQPLVNLEGRFIASPHWSPDGQLIAYQSNGKIYFYSAQTGTSSLVLEDNTGTKVYSPEEFSPNSQKLIIRVNWAFTPGQDEVIYDILSKTLITLQPTKPGWINPLGYVITTWADSNSIFGFYPASGPTGPGLWRVNANEGTIEPLVWSSTVPPMTGVLAPRYNVNGDLIYLYTLGEMLDSPLSLVRSASDGVTNRNAVRPETFYGFISLWTPNGDGLLLLQTNYPGNSAKNLVFIPMDSSLPVITLLPDASSIGETFRWGP